MTDNETESLFEFPCEYSLKVIGKTMEEFEIAVLSIIRQYVEHLKEDAISVKPSKKGNYQSLSITLEITSKKQLDKIYKALSECEHVLTAL